MRALTADQKEALRGPVIRPAMLVEIDHPHGIIRGWNGSGKLEWGDKTFEGMGLVGGVSATRSTQETRIQEVRYSIRALPTDVMQYVNVNVRNRLARMWLALLDEGLRIGRAEPILINEARLDRQSVELNENGRAEFALEAFNGFVQIEIASTIRWTPEDQKQSYPDDVGLDRVHLYENLEVTWTRT